MLKSTALIAIAAFMPQQTDRPKPPHIGSYIPNAQLLQWCKSSDPKEFAYCWPYIFGVANAAGITDSIWPKGHVELPARYEAADIIKEVVADLEKLPRERQSESASETVYAALVRKYPCSSWC